MKNYWKRFAEWAIALKPRLFLGARLKLTALYILNALVILAVFAAILGYLQLYYLETSLEGILRPDVDGAEFIQSLYEELRNATAILIGSAVVAIGVLSYFLVHITLRPIQSLVESQRRFISDASHELRTPLATIKTENEIALLDPKALTQEQAVAVLESNLEEIERISTILNNLLGLASFRSATGRPPLRAMDISETAGRVVERTKLFAHKRGVRLSAPNLPSVLVWANETGMEEVISNLIKNAVQFTPEGGEVVLRVRQRPKEKKAEIVVQDTGVGIPPEDLKYVFEPFYRSEKSLHVYQRGTGLGLPLVQEIVRRHRGSIDIQSAPDKGTVAIVLIPMAPKNAHSAPAKEPRKGSRT